MTVQLPRDTRYRLQRSEAVGPILLAVSAGLLAGGFAIFFRWLIDAVRDVFFGWGAALAASLPGGLSEIHFLLVPVAGLVLTSWIVRRWAPEASGHGVPEVQYAARRRGGRIRPRVAPIKAIASAITIGSGGSVGREGPIVQMGATLGSMVGQVSGLAPAQTKLLLACGAAGGIGATFNAPIAGVLFALEVILGSFAARSFGLVVIASVAATALSRAALGPEPAFHLVQPFALVSVRELPLYFLFGSVAGLLSTAYVRSIHGFEMAFERWRTSQTLKAAAGGLALGVMAYFGSTLILGVGYEGVDTALAGELALGMMVLLVVLKMLATSITLAAGGSGGVFAPALFIGAMAGGAFGQLANMVFPAWTAPSGAYALVGMAALFGGAAHAPITAVLILFEMTGDYQIILPLMLSVGVSYLVASRALRDSIYSIKLRRLIGADERRSEVDVLDVLLVDDVMSQAFETVAPTLGVDAIAELARSSEAASWPVANGRGELVGIVTATDLERAMMENQVAELQVSDIMTPTVITLQPGDTLRHAFRRFGQLDVRMIPVVEDSKARRIVGVLRRHEMLWAHRAVTEEHQRLLEAAGRETDWLPETAVQVEFHVGSKEGEWAAGRRIRDLDPPLNTLVSLIRRAGTIFVPHGGTRIESSDTLVFLTTKESEGALTAWLGARQRVGR